MRKFLFFIFLVICNLLSAQKFQWAKTIGSKSHENVSAHFVWKDRIVQPVNFHDSFYALGKWYYPNPDLGSTYLIYRNLEGKLVKVIHIKNDSIYPRDFKINSKGEMLISATIVDGIKLDNMVYRQWYEYWDMLLDSNGNFKIINRIRCKINNKSIQHELRSVSTTVFLNSYLSCVVLGNKNAWYYFNNDSFYNTIENNTILVKIDLNGKIINIKSVANNLIPSKMEYNEHSSTIILGTAIVLESRDTFKINSILYKPEENNIFFIYFDTNFMNTQVLRMPGESYASNPWTVQGKSNSIFYNAYRYADKDTTINVNNIKWRIHYGTNTICGFISNAQLKFVKLINVADSNFPTPIQALSPEFNGEYCVFSGQIVNPSFILPDSIRVNSIANDGNLFAMKLDTFGNILWHFWEGDKGPNETFINSSFINNDVILSGIIDGLTVFGMDTIITTGLIDALVVRITDNSIIRGNVHPGPYCAGDSIFIPYRAYGKYNDTNSFFAELSDENGNFYGTPRVLGSMKATSSGTVHGVLPLFDVVSSGNYRIRIRSNSPFVQSFMRYDSLYLLVYSKDKASPGKDTTVCYGNKVQIAAKGGTLWHWSPGNMVLDSTKRVTQFLGTQTTKLKITISDSSGCGLPDTAYQTITVLPAIKVTTKDTTVCINTPFKIGGSATGGQAGQLQFFWYAGVNLIAKDTLISIIQSDTFFTLIAIDNCGTKNDTAKIKISLPKPPDIFNTDTTVCNNAAIKIAGKSNTKNAHFAWSKSNNYVVTDTLNVTISGQTVVYIKAWDNCAADTSKKSITILVFPNPTLKVTADSICAITAHKLHLKGDSGQKPYQYWINSAKVDSSAPINVQLSQKILAEVSDKCNNFSSRQSVDLYQKPVAQIEPKAPVSCEPMELVIWAKNATKYFNIWKDNTGKIITNSSDTLHQTLPTAGAYVFKLVSKNALCMDSVNTTVNVWPKPVAAFEPELHHYLLSDELSVLINRSQIAKQYTWWWENKTKITITRDTLQIKFRDTGKLTIKLIAENQHGCRDTASDYIHIHPDPRIWFPNAITINRDGLNDVYYPDGIGIKSFQLTVINKWGQIVFKGKPNEPWLAGNNILPGVYVYRCVYSNWHNKKVESNGTVLVIK